MTQHGFVRGLFVVLLMATVPGGAAAADWPRWRGPELNGISRETGWLTSWPDGGPKVLWKARVGTGFSSFAIAQGRAYTMGNANDTDSVFCFDAATGRVIWRHDYPAPLDANSYEGGTSATPTVDGDRVYTLSKRGVMFCLDAAKGTVIWTKPLAEELGRRHAHLGICRIGAGRRRPAAGQRREYRHGFAEGQWNGGLEPRHREAGYATPVPFTSAGTRAAVLFTREHVVAVTVADGKELWRYPWKTRYDVNAADPILAGDQVFVSSGYNRGASVIQITGSTAEKVWENRNMRNHFNSCVRWEGHLYGVDETELRCLVWDTGEVKWSDRKFGKGSLMLADGHLIALSEKGELMVAQARPTEFKPLARAQVIGGKCWTTPVLANGRIYCRNAAGDVVCVDVRGQ